MKVLFLLSGNSKEFKIEPFIKSQAEALKQQGIDVLFFQIKGRGIKGYLKNIPRLRGYLKNNKFDLIHAHYTFNGLIALFSFMNLPIVVSYMGSDVYGEYDKYGQRKFVSNVNVFISKLIQPFIRAIIVKSPNLAKYVYLKRKLNLIPNGVQLSFFSPQSKVGAQNELGINVLEKTVLFFGDKKEERKNFALVEKSVRLLSEKAKIVAPYPVSPNDVAKYYNTVDVMILTSFNEGSPNVIKEAMACNCPIVSTDVGDVKQNIDGVEGCYITSFSSEDVAEKLDLALKFGKRTNGRDKIIKMGLDSVTVAKRIVGVYKHVLKLESS